MFRLVLEYRRFVQSVRSERERQSKLLELAGRLKGSLAENAEAIRAAYLAGEDILDPDLFEREDIVSFAKKHGILHDPQVVVAIESAQPREYGRKD